MKLARMMAALGMAAGLVLTVAPAVMAADPPTLGPTITDQTGKLAGGEGRISAAAQALKSEHNITFYVLFINSLDGENAGDFIDRTAAANHLGDGRNVLLLVSLNDRKDSVWASGKTSINNIELDSIRTSQVEPKLKAGDFIGSVEGAAVGFGQADAAVAPPPPAQVPVTVSKPIDWTPFGIFFGVLTIILVVLGIVWLIMKYASQRISQRRLARAEHDKMEQIGKDAHRALMGTDERVRTAEQELAFAEAEFGADTVASFRRALDVAKGNLQSAFKVGQEIDDDIPESYDERTRMLASIIDATTGVNEVLDAEMTKVSELRALEKTAADTLKKLLSQAPLREKQIIQAQTVLTALNLHGSSVVESVAKNIDVATALNEAAGKSLAEAQASVDAGTMAPAALSVRSAQEALAKSATALDSITKLGASLNEAERALDAELKSADAEISKAEAAVRDGKVDGLGSKLDLAKTTLRAAQKEAVAPQADYIAAYKAAATANSLADGVLDGVRDAQEKQQRAIAQAQAQVRAAQVSIDQANAYIESNRSTVGRKARNRLSEAQRQYEESRNNSDLFAAAAAAAIASQYADESYRYARSDVSAAYVPPPPPEPSYSSGSYDSGSSNSSSGSYDSGSSSHSSSDDSFSIGSFGGGSSSGGFGGGDSGGSSSSGGW